MSGVRQGGRAAASQRAGASWRAGDAGAEPDDGHTAREGAKRAIAGLPLSSTQAVSAAREGAKRAIAGLPLSSTQAVSAAREGAKRAIAGGPWSAPGRAIALAGAGTARSLGHWPVYKQEVAAGRSGEP